LKSGVRVLTSRGTLVKAGVHAPGRWEWSPLYFKEISWVGSNAFGVEEVDGHRKHAIAHYLDLVAAGGWTCGPCSPMRLGWSSGATPSGDRQTRAQSGAVKVAIDQR